MESHNLWALLNKYMFALTFFYLQTFQYLIFSGNAFVAQSLEYNYL